MNKIAITAIVPTLNEEAAIADCLTALQEFAKVIVVDSLSGDKTQDIARKMGAEVVAFHWNGRYPKKKQWCLDNLELTTEWIIFVDGDERPSPELLNDLRRLIAGDWPGDPVALDVPIAYTFMGRRLNHGHQVVKRCVMRWERCSFPEVADLAAPGMGEQEGHYQPTANGPIARTGSPLIHDDPDPLSSWIGRHNRYSDWEAYLRLHPPVRKQVRGLRSRQGGLFDRLPAKPLLFFFLAYIVRGGWRDGRAGLDYALGLSFYYWSIDAKVREGRMLSTPNSV